MSTKKSRLLILIILFFIISDLCAQWQKIDYPSIPSTIAIAVNSSNFIVSTDGQGVYKALNENFNWVLADSGLNPNTYYNSFDNKVYRLFCKGSKIFASSFSGLFVSTDNGTYWKKLDYYFSYVNCFEVVNDKLFIGTNDGIYVSTDDGSNWVKSSSGLPDGSWIFSIITNGSKMFTGANGDAVYMSTDDGKNWVNTRIGFPSGYVYVNALGVLGSLTFAGTDNGIYVTPDGINWIPDNSGLDDTYILTFTVNGQNIFAGTSYSIYRSTNNGTSWIKVNKGLPYQCVYKLITNNQNIYAAVESAGVYRSTDNGNSWTALNTGLPSMHLSKSAFGISGSNLLISLKNTTGTSSWPFGLFYSSDNGINWNYVNGLPFCFVNMVNVQDKNTYIATTKGVFISKDDGINWVASSDSISTLDVTRLLINGQNIYLGSVLGIYRSTDQGKNWSSIYNDNDNSNVINCMVTDGNNIYAGTNIGIIISTNGGNDWIKQKKIGSTSNKVDCIAVNGSSIFVIVDGLFLVSKDIGLTWQDVHPRFKNKSLNNLTTIDSNIYLLSDGKIFFSKDNGINWSSLVINLPNNETVDSFEMIGSKLYLTTINGIYSLSLLEIQTGIKDNENTIPQNYLLSQNYPNPFNPETVIQYQLPKAGNVTLKIYDILGREITTLINREKPAGIYEVKFDGTKIPSGIYFYRISSGNFVQTKKMILLK